jgi:hypothetical protein
MAADHYMSPGPLPLKYLKVSSKPLFHLIFLLRVVGLRWLRRSGAVTSFGTGSLVMRVGRGLWSTVDFVVLMAPVTERF